MINQDDSLPLLAKFSASLPYSRELLSEKLTPTTVRATASKQSTKRGKYAKFTPECQAKVARYTVMYGNTAAQCHFSKSLEADLEYHLYVEDLVPG